MSRMDEQRTRGVHLFHDDVLIANLVTTEAFPEATYVVSGVCYRVLQRGGPHLEKDGDREGWDIQVARVQ